MCGSSPPYLLHSFIRPSIPLFALRSGYEGSGSARPSVPRAIGHLTARTQHTDSRNARHNARNLILNRAILTLQFHQAPARHPSPSRQLGLLSFSLPPLLFQVVCVGRAHRPACTQPLIGALAAYAYVVYTRTHTPYPYSDPWAFLRSCTVLRTVVYMCIASILAPGMSISSDQPCAPPAAESRI